MFGVSSELIVALMDLTDFKNDEFVYVF